MNKRILIFAAVVAAFGLKAQAKVRLPHLLSDGMVIQQNADAHLLGMGHTEEDGYGDDQLVDGKGADDGR